MCVASRKCARFTPFYKDIARGLILGSLVSNGVYCTPMEKGTAAAKVRGHIHPISDLIRESNRIFYDMGFTYAEGPLVEDEWHNFDALNFPKDHPARDMQDTFFMKDEKGNVLRTHTSNVQIRYMESQTKQGILPPYRAVSLGKVFRNEATDITHEAEFFQMEGLAVGEDVSLGNLKGTLSRYFRLLFKGANVDVRFRPSFFPFTEPSVEVDMRITGELVPEKLRDRWIEMAGAGMVHPNVLKNAGVDPQIYQGFAFGIGLDRLAILRWGIDDIRLMHSADLRFINQF
jgi:phenylalanyl-tRNA synthetase alpha chain